MATHVGKEGSVFVDSNQVAEINGWEVTATGEPVEDSELKDEWRTYKSGSDIVKEWSGTLEMHYDETDTDGQGALTAGVVGAEVTLNLYPEGDGSPQTGDQYFTGTAIITEHGASVAKGEIIARPISFQGTGPLTVSTV